MVSLYGSYLKLPQRIIAIKAVPNSHFFKVLTHLQGATGKSLTASIIVSITKV